MCVIDYGQAYLSRNPSASIVNKMENLLRTVNIGRLERDEIHLISKYSKFDLKHVKMSCLETARWN